MEKTEMVERLYTILEKEGMWQDSSTMLFFVDFAGVSRLTVAMWHQSTAVFSPWIQKAWVEVYAGKAKEPFAYRRFDRGKDNREFATRLVDWFLQLERHGVGNDEK